MFVILVNEAIRSSFEAFRTQIRGHPTIICALVNEKSWFGIGAETSSMASCQEVTQYIRRVVRSRKQCNLLGHLYELSGMMGREE